MASYFDATKNVVVTEERLVQLGYPTSDTLLRKANIYPIDYKYPSYNSDTQRIEPDGKPVKDISCLGYNQHFTVVDLTDEEKAAIQKTRSEAAAKSSLIEIDAETSRPLRAWINGEASEWDLEKLYDLECRAKKARAVLQGKPEPVCQKYTPGLIPSGPTVPPTTPTPHATQLDEPTSEMESNPQA